MVYWNDLRDDPQKYLSMSRNEYPFHFYEYWNFWMFVLSMSTGNQTIWNTPQIICLNSVEEILNVVNKKIR